ncbi:MAG: ABC transporter ATP-binding protein [Labrys sp. (in: a-proteobacteria)]
MAEIAIRSVEKTYGKNKVVHGVDLTIANGEFVVILGPSGCGKSTLLRMIAGLEGITAGEIAIGGTVVNRLEPRERGCAMVFQNYALYPHMSVADNIGYALKVAGVPRATRRQRVEAMARTVGLADFLDRKPGQLSGGQRQRVAMARAMIREPKVFLCDEPLSNLDAQLRVQMRIEIRRMHQRLGTTSVFVTHDQIEAMTLADRLVVMNSGRIDQAGTPADVYARPATRFVASFIGSPSMNLLRATVGPDDALFIGEGRRIGGSAPPGLRAGDQVDIGFRPELAEFAAEGTRGALPFRVEFVEDVGSARLFHGAVDGIDVVASLAPGTPGRAGDQIGLLVRPEQLHAFDVTHGRRLDFALPVTPSASAPAAA